MTSQRIRTPDGLCTLKGNSMDLIETVCLLMRRGLVFGHTWRASTPPHRSDAWVASFIHVTLDRRFPGDTARTRPLLQSGLECKKKTHGRPNNLEPLIELDGSQERALCFTEGEMVALTVLQSHFKEIQRNYGRGSWSDNHPFATH